MVLVLETGGDPAREVEAVGAVLDRQVDGIVFATMRARELFVPSLPDSTRAVMLNATNSQFGASVLPDEESGGRSAVDLLAAAGHRDGIVLIGQNDEVEQDLFRSATVARRVHGVRSEMAEFGLRFAAEESCWEWEPENGYALTSRVMDRGDEVRALLCMNDRLAFGAYQACQERGLVVGRDVSIVSFDNDEIAAYLRPGLTTIQLPPRGDGPRSGPSPAVGRVGGSATDRDAGRRAELHRVRRPQQPGGEAGTRAAGGTGIGLRVTARVAGISSRWPAAPGSRRTPTRHRRRRRG